MLPRAETPSMPIMTCLRHQFAAHHAVHDSFELQANLVERDQFLHASKIRLELESAPRLPRSTSFFGASGCRRCETSSFIGKPSTCSSPNSSISTV